MPTKEHTTQECFIVDTRTGEKFPFWEAADGCGFN